METAAPNLQERERSRPGPTAQFILPSLSIGLLVGSFEALLLRTSPRVAALQSCDTRYVIWFLAPLVDMVFFGIVVAFVALTWRWFHVEMALGSFSFQEHVLVPCMYFFAGFALSLAIFARVNKLGALFERWLWRTLKPAAWCLAFAASVAIAGVCFFEGKYSNSLTRVRAASSSASRACFAFCTTQQPATLLHQMPISGRL